MESANEEEDGIYEVEAILGHQKYKNRIFYKIKWKGYPIDECTWEEKSNLFCPDILNEYLAQKSKRRSKRKRANSKSKKSYPKSLIKSGNSLSTLEKIQSYEEMLFPSKQPEYEATFNPPPPLPPPFTFNTQIRPNNFISQGGTTNTQEKEAANSDHYLSIHEANNSQSEKSEVTMDDSPIHFSTSDYCFDTDGNLGDDEKINDDEEEYQTPAIVMNLQENVFGFNFENLYNFEHGYTFGNESQFANENNLTNGEEEKEEESVHEPPKSPRKKYMQTGTGNQSFFRLRMGCQTVYKSKLFDFQTRAY